MASRFPEVSEMASNEKTTALIPSVGADGGLSLIHIFPAYGVRFIAINDNVDTENDAADDLTVSRCV